MTAKELIDIIAPKHDRTSCGDENSCNGFEECYEGGRHKFRCARCALIEIENGEEIPEDMEVRFTKMSGKAPYFSAGSSHMVK